MGPVLTFSFNVC